MTWNERGISYEFVSGDPLGIGEQRELSAEAAYLRGEVSQLFDASALSESMTPGGFIEASGSTVAPGRFLISLTARYAPGTIWPDLGFGAADVPAIQRIDFSVNKPMWHDRMHIQVVLRNALNAADRSHPLGAQWNLRTHLAATIELPPFPRGTP